MSCEYAVQVIVVTPAGKGASAWRVHAPCISQASAGFGKQSQLYIGWPSLRTPENVTLSPVTVGFPILNVAEQLLSAAAVWSAGQAIVGAPGFGGLTITLKLQLSPVVAEPVTVVVPTGKKQSLQWSTVITPHSVVPVGGVK